MKYLSREKYFILLSSIASMGFSSVAYADAAGNPHHSSRHVETGIEIEYFSLSDSKSDIGNAVVGTSGMLIEGEYEAGSNVFTFGYEKWDYNWKNAESLPFTSGQAAAPWTTFTTYQLGYAYEYDLNDEWELNYYIEVESSFEKETKNSNEYELGIDFTYQMSDIWEVTFNINQEYLDATGSEFGVDIEFEFNHDKKDGWSGEFELSSEFPEISLTYHFTKALSLTMFYNENGTNTIRLSDSSSVTGMQAGYLEDEYNSLGIGVNYEFSHESYLTFKIQQNSGRSLSFEDSSGRESSEAIYKMGDTVGASLVFTYAF